MKPIAFVLALGLLAVQAPAVQLKPDAMGPHCLMPRPTLLAQEGNPGHKEPPPGWTCASSGEHACACHRACQDTTTENEDGSQSTSTTVVEDPRCRVYCFKDHCRCPVHNCD